MTADDLRERVKTYGIRDICDDEFEAMLLELHASEAYYDAVCSRAGCVGDNHVEDCPVMLAWQDHRAATQARRDFE